mmetsp:Transcript_69846/g.194222  ORF Transcript_69846/g.194222 Transcript_69846/m.194222 type:complete len:220 (-) Transcript_69846:276-935(-)
MEQNFPVADTRQLPLPLLPPEQHQLQLLCTSEVPWMEARTGAPENAKLKPRASPNQNEYWPMLKPAMVSVVKNSSTRKPTTKLPMPRNARSLIMCAPRVSVPDQVVGVGVTAVTRRDSLLDRAPHLQINDPVQPHRHDGGDADEGHSASGGRCGDQLADGEADGSPVLVLELRLCCAQDVAKDPLATAATIQHSVARAIGSECESYVVRAITAVYVFRW